MPLKGLLNVYIAFIGLIFVFECISPRNVSAQSDYSLVSITPNATDVLDELPPVPARQTVFGWAGQAGSTYSIVISAASEPAMVVGVGCRVTSTSYDSNTDQLTINAEYSGEKISADDAIELPQNTFLIILDPGVDDSKISAVSDGTITAQGAEKCYGPGASPKSYRDESNDFGDDDGLNDPEVGDDGSETVGFPLSAAGSFASTNIFYWCAIPNQNGVNRLGLGLAAKQSETARLEIFLSSGALSYLSGLEGKSVTASNSGIYSGGSQVSVDVGEQSSGAYTRISLKIENGLNALISSFGTLNAKGLRATEITASSLNRRSILLGVREPVSIAPETNKVETPALKFFGFVDDAALAGQLIEIRRLGGNQKCDPTINAFAGTIVATTPIQSNGSWGVKVPSSALFKDNAKKSKVVAGVKGDATRQSREVSLTNKNRANRR